MPLLVLEASQLIALGLVAVLGAAAVWMIGHTIEKDVTAVGGAIVTPVLSVVRNPGFIIAALVGIFLIVRRGRKKG
jgi:hypothetical protein